MQNLIHDKTFKIILWILAFPGICYVLNYTILFIWKIGLYIGTFIRNLYEIVV